MNVCCALLVTVLILQCFIKASNKSSDIIMQNTFGNTFWPSIVMHLAVNYDGKTISSVSGIYKSATLIDPSILYKANAVRE